MTTDSFVKIGPRQESSLPRSIPFKDWIIGVLGFLAVMGVTAGVGRLFMGLQDSTALSDDVSWGIWIGFDFGLIAFAGAGFTMAAVVHVFHLEQFHKALRPAILAGLMGYVGVLLLLVLDLGRWAEVRPDRRVRRPVRVVGNRVLPRRRET